MSENEIAGTPRPAGWDAATIYAWLKDGAGPEATTDRSRDAWEDIAKRYDGVRETVRQALRDGQVAFEGEAGDAMAQRVEPLAAHADTAQQAATSTADAIGQQGTDFRDARNQVVPPVAVPDKPFLNDLAPWETDYDEAKAGSRAADEHDIRVLGNYGDATRSNIGGLPQFEQPPSVTPQLDIPSSSTAQVGGSPQPIGGVGGAPSGPPGVGGSLSVAGQPGSMAQPGVVGVPGGGSGTGPTPPGGGSAGRGAPTRPGLPGAAAGVGAVASGPRGAGPVVPAPVPLGAGGVDAGGRERWRQTKGPGLFGNSNAGRSGAGSGIGSGGRSGTGSGGGSATGKAPGVDAGKGAAGATAPAAGTAAGTPGARGAGGAPGAGMAGAGATRRGEEDQEHVTKYLEKTDDHWGDGRAVAPPVIGAEPER